MSSQGRWQMGAATVAVSGVLGAVYSVTVLTMGSNSLAVGFLYGAALGGVCAAGVNLVNGLLAWVGLAQRPLLLTLLAGVCVGLSVGLLARQDVVLCAMVGEVAALLTSGDAAVMEQQ